tara:strand:- start:351 stop:545 length:195 start_codon:yes stop_codon:yes gene_type:complete
VVERFFWEFKTRLDIKNSSSTREYMKQDVADYMKYYNQDRLHTANGNMSSIKYEISQKKVSGWS